MLLAIAICGGGLCLWYSPLRWYFLKLDDFVYLGRSRTREQNFSAADVLDVTMTNTGEIGGPRPPSATNRSHDE